MVYYYHKLFSSIEAVSKVQNECKNALAYMNKLYKRGILDKQFLLRNQNNIEDIIKSSQCGAFFGLWLLGKIYLAQMLRRREN